MKILLHQDGHLTPTYPAGHYVFDIGDQTYDEILNKWFSHYLYGVENNAENMPAVTAQDSHDTNTWNSFASWKAEDSMTFTVDAAEDDTTTISSAYADNGITSSNWQSKFTEGTTAGSVMYTQTAETDLIIKGSIAVSFSALTDNYSDPAPVTSPAPTEDPRGYDTPNGAIDHDNMMAELSDDTGSDIALFAADELDIQDRDALMVSAMLVDIAPGGETFKAFNTSGSYVPKTDLAAGGAWMGGGLENFDLKELKASDVSCKIISRGWMDLCNPAAGFDSNTASKRVTLDGKTYYDYTIYLQPTVYSVEAGHTLALVIYAHEPGMTNYYSWTQSGGSWIQVANPNFQDYQITVKDASVKAVIPLSDAPVDMYTVNYEAGANGTVTSSVPNGSTVMAGSEVTLTAKADSGYYCDGWTVNGVKYDGGSEKTFTVNENVTIAASFAKITISGGNPSQVITDSDKDSDKDDTGETKDDDKGETTPELPFTDVKGHWAADAIRLAYDNRLMNGVTDDTFAPDATLTRAMLVTTLYRMEGEPEVSGTAAFTDVVSGSWYEKAVMWASANGIVSGVSDTSFAPDANITREQLAAMLYRYAQYKKYDSSVGEDTNILSYDDAQSISEYAVPAIQWAVSAGLINGRTDTTIVPGGAATRAETASILARFSENAAK